MRAGLIAAALLLATLGLAENRWMSDSVAAAMPAPARSGMADVNGINVYCATHGAGDPVWRIHGGLVASGKSRPLTFATSRFNWVGSSVFSR